MCVCERGSVCVCVLQNPLCPSWHFSAAIDLILSRYAPLFPHCCSLETTESDIISPSADRTRQLRAQKFRSLISRTSSGSSTHFLFSSSFFLSGWRKGRRRIYLQSRWRGRRKQHRRRREHRGHRRRKQDQGRRRIYLQSRSPKHRQHKGKQDKRDNQRKKHQGRRETYLQNR